MKFTGSAFLCLVRKRENSSEMFDADFRQLDDVSWSDVTSEGRP
jgi:hypothetical protein